MRAVLVVAIATIFVAAVPALGNADGQGKEVRVVGCVQWEKDYRSARHFGNGGALGTGIGVGNEFVLTKVKPEGGRTATAYSITGDREKELGRRIGQQIQVIGVVENEGKPDSGHFGDLPRIKMTAWIPVKDACTE